MITYVIRRLLLLIPVLIGVTMITFTLTRIIPGDPISLMISPMASQEARDRLTEKSGLNDPIAVQYVHYISGIFHGDLGDSFVTRQPVLSDLTSRFMPTFELTLIAMMLAITPCCSTRNCSGGLAGNLGRSCLSIDRCNWCRNAYIFGLG